MLVNKTNQLIEEVNELKDSYMKMFGSEMFDYMDENTFVLFKKSFDLKVIESINKKLDKLLARKES